MLLKDFNRTFDDEYCRMNVAFRMVQRVPFSGSGKNTKCGKVRLENNE